MGAVGAKTIDGIDVSPSTLKFTEKTGGVAACPKLSFTNFLKITLFLYLSFVDFGTFQPSKCALREI